MSLTSQECLKVCENVEFDKSKVNTSHLDHELVDEVNDALKTISLAEPLQDVVQNIEIERRMNMYAWKSTVLDIPHCSSLPISTVQLVVEHESEEMREGDLLVSTDHNNNNNFISHEDELLCYHPQYPGKHAIILSTSDMYQLDSTSLENDAWENNTDPLSADQLTTSTPTTTYAANRLIAQDDNHLQSFYEDVIFCVMGDFADCSLPPCVDLLLNKGATVLHIIPNVSDLRKEYDGHLFEALEEKMAAETLQAQLGMAKALADAEIERLQQSIHDEKVQPSNDINNKNTPNQLDHDDENELNATCISTSSDQHPSDPSTPNHQSLNHDNHVHIDDILEHNDTIDDQYDDLVDDEVENHEDYDDHDEYDREELNTNNDDNDDNDDERDHSFIDHEFKLARELMDNQKVDESTSFVYNYTSMDEPEDDSNENDIHGNEYNENGIHEDESNNDNDTHQEEIPHPHLGRFIRVWTHAEYASRNVICSTEHVATILFRNYNVTTLNFIAASWETRFLKHQLLLRFKEDHDDDDHV